MLKGTVQAPIDVREVTLPGVGKKFVMPLRDGGNLAIVVKPDGERQMYHFLEDDDRPSDVFKLDRDESQQLANLLGGAMTSAPDLEKLELALGALEIEWVTLERDAALAGRTLQNFPLRTQNGRVGGRHHAGRYGHPQSGRGHGVRARRHRLDRWFARTVRGGQGTHFGLRLESPQQFGR